MQKEIWFIKETCSIFHFVFPVVDIISTKYQVNNEFESRSCV